MRFKHGVSLKGVSPQVAIALQVCDSIYNWEAEFCDFTNDEMLDWSMVVTSINDGRHGKSSWHYKGRAFDLRVHNVTNPITLHKQIAKDLGHDWDVILEKLGTPNAHIHAEYDPK